MFPTSALFNYLVDELDGQVTAAQYPEGGEGRITMGMPTPALVTFFDLSVEGSGGRARWAATIYPEHSHFNLYRAAEGGIFERVNGEPITASDSVLSQSATRERGVSRQRSSVMRRAA